jgi:rSAM/selenodomain-associated transferase 2
MTIINNTQNRRHACEFSIIIPVLDEAECINPLIRHLRKHSAENCYEIIIVDGDPQGGTINVIQDKNVICMTSDKGRAVQMNAGAKAARGKVLLFLHADTRLPQNALTKIENILKSEKYVAGAFDLKIDSDKLLLKYIAAKASIRSRINRIPYGDQATFIRKSYFEKIGGFAEIPLMEDIDLMRRIKKRGDKIHIFRDHVVTSSRRWKKEGVFYTTLRNRVLTILYFLGVSPEKLAKYYKGHSE